MKKNIYGRMHSIETLGARDGPGLRCVFFFSGCNYRCKFCQNPDTWTQEGSFRISLDQAAERIGTLLPYLRQNNGGITASGGEPTMQPGFLLALFKLAHELKLHTALDTNGTCEKKYIKKVVDETDLVLLDIKACGSDLHKNLTGYSNKQVFDFGSYCSKFNGKLRIRRVILPGINDSENEFNLLADYIKSLENMPEIELIQYHTLGVHKWEELGIKNPLEGLKPDPASLKKAFRFFSSLGIKII